jgi:hypothetical protein
MWGSGIIKMNATAWILLISLVNGCSNYATENPFFEGLRPCSQIELEASHDLGDIEAGTGALLATRFSSLEELKRTVKIEYLTVSGNPLLVEEKAEMVRVCHCSNGREVVGILKEGVSQDDISDAQKGGIGVRIELLLHSPFSIRNREDLKRVLALARRLPLVYGEGDPAFYDIAEQSVRNISKDGFPFKDQRDSTEKGYLNSFNHLTAQAFISSIFSEEIADFVADVHERKNMPELISGLFDESQLADPIDNPIDNYVDMINNEWGQELGKQLKAKYNIKPTTFWTPQLLADYLNDLQSYYSWAFKIGFSPFRADEDLILRFSKKVNVITKVSLP